MSILKTCFISSSFFLCSAIAAVEPSTLIQLSPGQTHFAVKLSANPTTGYQWFLTQYPSKAVHFIGYHYEINPAPKGMVGVPGYSYFTFSTEPDFQVGPQEVTLEFVYQQPWVGGAVSAPYPVKVMVLPIDVSQTTASKASEASTGRAS